VIRLALALAFALFASGASAGSKISGFNVIVSPAHPFGSASARVSLAALKSTGASAVAIVPFLWQSGPFAPDIIRGADMSDDELRAAIHDARALGLKTIVKPHVWVDGAWAGAVAPRDEGDWAAWFARYRHEILRLARVAAEAKADVFCVGTELVRTTSRPEWSGVVRSVRAVFPGKLVYIAHNADEAEVVPFWDHLDFVGASLYPPLAGDEVARESVMRRTADRLAALSARAGKPILIGEIGLRSAQGAAAKPWESAEEREAAPDMQLQSDILAEWLRALDRPQVAGILVWRWFTDPNAGGPLDTDFTVQGKPAEGALRCAWSAC
jgi:sugar phosphate isomerase/epimerase